MSGKTATILTRTEPETKAAADAIFDKIGMSTATAVNVFLHKAVEVGGLPFEPRVNELELATLHKAPGVQSMDALSKEEVLKSLMEAKESIEKDGGKSASQVFAELEKDFGA